MNIDVVIIGTGRVGLTLGFMLAKVGLKVVGIDKNKSIIEKINKNEMPFHEPKFDEIIKEVDFSVREDYGIISKSKNVIISIGTPLLPNIEADFSQLNSVMNELVKNLVEFQNIIIRSTVAPKTMEYIKNYLEKNTNMKVGENLFLSFAPERVAEGKIWDELQNLPQIIGVEDEKSFKKANEIFQLFTKKIFKTNYLSAELVKLFNNSSRYVNFAISNYYAIIAEKFNQDIYEILKMANYDYPRGEIPSPGLTSGTCLRKDFGFISETFPFSDIFLSSWRINEYMPKFIVDSVCNKVKIQNRNVTILGYTFKQDSDDIRDSLVPKLIRYIKKELPDNIFVVEPNLDLTDEGYENCLLLDAVKKGDIIFITIPHSEFIDKNDEIFDLAKDDAYFIDIWNVMNKNKIFFKKWMEL
ncbi:MAG: nucleotide sugar dehydrogenase [Methanobrevibacter sp.]|nr:nucleotide sugar dehydrogenase [Candidatus Methanovirga basalitermitum]